MPWLLWNFDRQRWPDKELVIVDSSEVPVCCERDDVKVIAVAHGLGVARKRNLALTHASGECVAWFDDDDWQHPDRLGILMKGMVKSGAIAAGTRRSWFVDLWAERCSPCVAPSGVFFNTAVFRTEQVRCVRFDERVRRASDAAWLQRALRARGDGVYQVPEVLGAWLTHRTNISNPSSARRSVLPLERIRRAIGDGPWGETSQELERLRERLRRPHLNSAVSSRVG